MKNLLIIFLTTVSTGLNAQNYGLIQATEIASMPTPTSNNAVVGGWANDTAYVYSFGGIDNTKIWSGINKKSFRYNTVTDIWDTIPDLPNTNAVIAAGASYVDSIIYIMGGYQVLSNGNEISSNIVNRFDPRTNTYLSDGAAIPIPIDDHVQAVWNDSLIYVITGWSNTGNVPNVQIYDPANDNWLTGTSVPNNNTYKAFGATGIIINNKIYYHGGAVSSGNFPGQSNLRVGQIDPNDPTQISWSSTWVTNYISYRAIALFDSWTNLPVFVGGSDNTYNYNGVAYNGAGGVSPKSFSIGFDNSQSLPLGYGKARNSVTLKNNPINDSLLPMDLRGVAFPYSQFSYITGGMLRNQAVSNKTFRIEFLHTTKIKEHQQNVEFSIYPNPTSENLNLVFDKSENRTITLIDILGKTVYQTKSNENKLQIDVSNYPKGVYFVQVKTEKDVSALKIVVE